MQKTLRDYENLIRDKVREMDARDPNWKWSIHSFAKDRVRIRWGYLDYCKEKDNCFYLIMSSSDDEDYPQEYWLSVRTPGNALIRGEFVTSAEGKRSWQVSWESGIQILLNELEYYARTRY